MSVTIFTSEKQILVTGNTYDCKSEIKEAGGRWNADSKGWDAPASSLNKMKAVFDGMDIKLSVKPLKGGSSSSSSSSFATSSSKTKSSSSSGGGDLSKTQLSNIEKRVKTLEEQILKLLPKTKIVEKKKKEESESESSDSDSEDENSEPDVPSSSSRLL